jgi:hypothetical protein
MPALPVLAAIALASSASTPSASPEPPLPATTAVAPAPVAEHPRALRVVSAEDGGFAAYRGSDPAPIRGADLYRATLRLDLLDGYHRQVERRRFLWIGAGTAVVAGPLLGWAFAKALQESEADPCLMTPPSPACQRTAEERAADEKAMRQALGVGTAAGLLIGGGFAWWALSTHPHTPTLEEARDLADSHNARLTAPASPPALPPRASLRVAPLGGGAYLALRLRF